jgi:pSer/pThr/pTyr-binding forkhead associated (FHA) protein
MALSDGSKTQFALRFISGKYQGGEFPIAAEREIYIGRSNELDVVLVEDMVSRKHAKISWHNDALIIEDLGSTNGTFVNGEKIKRARLKEGDRVLVGTSIVRIALSAAVGVAPPSAQQEADARVRMQSVATRTNTVKAMTGSIDELPLVDLLQLFATSKKSGVLVLTRDNETGKLFLRKGQIAFASINENAEIAPLKCVFRLLTWESGTFEMQGPDDREFAEELNLSTEAILMEGMRHLDETRRLQPQLPMSNARVMAPQPLTPLLKDLNEKELTVWQLAWNVGRFGPLLDRSRYSDLETIELFLKLVTRGYLKAE